MKSRQPSSGALTGVAAPEDIYAGKARKSPKVSIQVELVNKIWDGFLLHGGVDTAAQPKSTLDLLAAEGDL